jgi:hypothetical protein
MNSLEHMERRLKLQVDESLHYQERLARIKEAYAVGMENEGHPDLADMLRQYSEVDMLFFIQQVARSR